nr:MAG TPA: hypothetical protein [Caudoviricetes sp.]
MLFYVNFKGDYLETNSMRKTNCAHDQNRLYLE